MNTLEQTNNKEIYTSADLKTLLEQAQGKMSPACFYKKLNSLLKDKKIARCGRNAYCIPQKKSNRYNYEYSEEANALAIFMEEKYPLLDFSISELYQLNEFVNHLIAQNTIFLYIEKDYEIYVFNELIERYPGKVLYFPDNDTFDHYRCPDMIVIGRLRSEYPRNNEIHWRARLEKLLVDLISEPIFNDCTSYKEIINVLKGVFSRYIVNESSLFRYASRRGCLSKLKALIEQYVTA